MKNRARAIVFLLALLVAGAAAAAPVPSYQGWVTDNAGIIPDGQERELSAFIQSVKDKTGAEIAVLTVPTTDGEDIFDFAMRVAEAWKPGQKEKDNGVVFVVASEDRKLHILVGYGLEGVLPDGKVGAIEDEYIIPSFKEGNYAAGIEAGVRMIALVIAPDLAPGMANTGTSPATTYSSSPARAPGIWDLVKLGIMAIIFLYLLIRHPRLLLFLLLSGRGGGGRRGGGFGGGFGGFGGGGFGGGGAGRSW